MKFLLLLLVVLLVLSAMDLMLREGIREFQVLSNRLSNGRVTNCRPYIGPKSTMEVLCVLKTVRRVSTIALIN